MQFVKVRGEKDCLLDHYFVTIIIFLLPGGSLIVTAINRTFFSIVPAVGMVEYLLNLIPRGK